LAEQPAAYFLSLDSGTQSVRALLFDQRGELVARSQEVIEPYESPRPGWAEQRVDYYWDALCRACQQLWSATDVPRAALRAVSVTTQRATAVPLDGQGNPLRPAITWLDQRRVDSRPDLKWWERLGMRALGASRTVAEFHARAQANWIARHEPQLWRQTERFLLLSGYHVYRLTGQFRDAVASQVGFIPFDFRKLQWAAPASWQWRALPLTPGMLPRLVPAGSVLGQVTASAARETGIPAGLPVIASGSDKACEVLGSGCVDPSLGSLSYGTRATFNLTSDTYLEALPPFPPFPGVIPGTYNAEVAVPRGYWMVSWFRREFGLREEQLAAATGVAPESLFDDLLRSVPPGSLGLTLQPYWSGGLGDTGPEAKGAIIGFGEVHTRAHVYRAVIEGLTYALREGKERMVRRIGKPVSSLRVSGGGSQSDEVMQITADIFGLPAVRPHTFETSGLGAAIAAAVGTGLYPDFYTACEQMTREGKRFMPNRENSRIYDRLYSEVYQRIYPSLQPAYKSIRAITGYPD